MTVTFAGSKTEGMTGSILSVPWGSGAGSAVSEEDERGEGEGGEGDEEKGIGSRTSHGRRASPARASLMDVRYDHPSLLHVLRAAPYDAAHDLIAVGGDHEVEVLHISDAVVTPLACFNVGSRITALAWSPRAVSPSSSDHWLVELVAASADFGLHLLTKTTDQPEVIFPFGGGLSGHHGPVNDVSFCGGRAPDNSRYVATVSDDKMLMVWDLQPTLDIPSTLPSPSPAPTPRPPASNTNIRPQPTAYAVPFLHPLVSLASHPSTSNELVVADSRGSVFLIDWRSDPSRSGVDLWPRGGASVIELVDPRALAEPASTARPGPIVNSIGASYGSRFAIWDLSKLHGGKPASIGLSYAQGVQRFRWCPTHTTYFALTPSPLASKGAHLHVHNAAYIHAQPTPFTLGPRSSRIQDFDWLATPGIPRIAAAIGRSVVVFFIGVD
ncbi:hypothetical protein EVG20_g635 [Dentipellis fragilis]|uniref:Uncharacterized protein n=1 Tax=Dentipellis fragilis TaxID=205917 RepID=A0A4Y9ZE16_9AGAM|nr:hypothetical protein EVG20_g635 [Dentipellis fragilis]